MIILDYTLTTMQGRKVAPRVYSVYSHSPKAPQPPQHSNKDPFVGVGGGGLVMYNTVFTVTPQPSKEILHTKICIAADARTTRCYLDILLQYFALVLRY